MGSLSVRGQPSADAIIFFTSVNIYWGKHGFRKSCQEQGIFQALPS